MEMRPGFFSDPNLVSFRNDPERYRFIDQELDITQDSESSWVRKLVVEDKPGKADLDQWAVTYLQNMFHRPNGTCAGCKKDKVSVWSSSTWKTATPFCAGCWNGHRVDFG